MKSKRKNKFSQPSKMKVKNINLDQLPNDDVDDARSENE